MYFYCQNESFKFKAHSHCCMSDIANINANVSNKDTRSSLVDKMNLVSVLACKKVK